jgi:hypothetical protein
MTHKIASKVYIVLSLAKVSIPISQKKHLWTVGRDFIFHPWFTFASRIMKGNPCTEVYLASVTHVISKQRFAWFAVTQRSGKLRQVKLGHCNCLACVSEKSSNPLINSKFSKNCRGSISLMGRSTGVQGVRGPPPPKEEKLAFFASRKDMVGILFPNARKTHIRLEFSNFLGSPFSEVAPPYPRSRNPGSASVTFVPCKRDTNAMWCCSPDCSRLQPFACARDVILEICAA